LIATVIVEGNPPLLMPATTIGAVADDHHQFNPPLRSTKVTETETHYIVGAWKILKKYSTRIWWGGSAEEGNCIVPKEVDFYAISYYGYTFKYVLELRWLPWYERGGGSTYPYSRYSFTLMLS